MPVQAEAKKDENSDKAEAKGDEHAEASGRALRLDGSGQSPFTKEIPDADAEMKRGGEDPDGHEGEKKWVGEILRDVVVGGFAVREPAFGIKMPADEDESDESGDALEEIKVVADPRIRGNVGLAAEPDVDAIGAVKENGKKNEGPFDEGPVRDGLELTGDVIVFFSGDQGGAVGPEMFGEKGPDGDDTG